MSVPRLTETEVSALLAEFPDWTLRADGKALTRTLKFADFNAAFGFMTRVALKADQMDHHPEWFNVYNRVEVVLTTHDADGVTELDLALAQFMDAAASGLGVPA